MSFRKKGCIGYFFKRDMKINIKTNLKCKAVYLFKFKDLLPILQLPSVHFPEFPWSSPRRNHQNNVVAMKIQKFII